MRTHLLMATLMTLLATSAPWALADDAAPDLLDGNKLLKERNFQQALEFFNAAARITPDNINVLFGRAQALEGIGRRPEAVQQFQACLLLNPPAAMREACNRELDYMTTRPPVIPPPTLTEHEVEKAATAITNQAAERIRAVQNSCVYSSRPIYVSRSSSRSYKPIYYRRDPDYNSIADSQRRAQALRECADALRTDMSTRPSAWDGIYLSPQGTNLYVRNYVTFDAQKPEVIEPTKAKELTFADMKNQTKKK